MESALVYWHVEVYLSYQVLFTPGSHNPHSQSSAAVKFEGVTQNIRLFGLRKKIEKVEEEAVKIVKEGLESSEST
ncbi:hypothetical protein Tco_0163778 [Tanacetum coccineum]